MNQQQPDPSRPPFPDKVDSSILASFDACEVKGYKEYIEHLSPSLTSVDLHAGGAFSAGIEATRNALWVDGKDLIAAQLAGMRDFMMYWGDYEPPEGHTKSFGNVLGALFDYFRHYDPRMDPVKPYILQSGKPAVEFTFALPTEVKHPVSGEPVIYCGRFDLLGYYNDVLFIIDEKTTGRTPTATWMTQYAMRGQFIGYIWAAQQYGFPVSNALVRMIVILKTQYKQLQAPITIADWQIRRWYEDMNRKVERLVRAWETDTWIHSYGDACSSYNGCPYLGLCTQEDERLWHGDYKIRYWNPLEKDPTRRNMSPEELEAKP